MNLIYDPVEENCAEKKKLDHTDSRKIKKE